MVDDVTRDQRPRQAVCIALALVGVTEANPDGITSGHWEMCFFPVDAIMRVVSSWQEPKACNYCGLRYFNAKAH